jgi:hypothetical protein
VPISVAENQLRQVYSHLGTGLVSVRVEAFTGAGGRILVDFYIGEPSLFFSLHIKRPGELTIKIVLDVVK